MKPLIPALTYLLCSISNCVQTSEVTEIIECPELSPRARAKSVHDLRPNDIEVIAGMGDSVSAGLLMKNVETQYIDIDSSFVEFRGSSFSMGGDSDAQSIPAYLRRYQPDLIGASKGQRPTNLCPETFFCTSAMYRPEIDYFNAAQSGATTRELLEQVEYLKQYIGQGSPLADKWKLINLYIGYNDGSVSCLPGRNVSDYRLNIQTALSDLINNIDYAFINLIGLTHYNELVNTVATTSPDYRKKFADGRNDLSNYECYCCSKPNGGIDFIGKQVSGYNMALQSIAEEIQKTTKKNVTAVYQPTAMIPSTVPYYTLSNVDGYHPNELGHKFLARRLWSQMFLKKADKVHIAPYDSKKPVYCPSDNDRFQTN